jgi:predicted benzoate:H+ symporter BenE
MPGYPLYSGYLFAMVCATCGGILAGTTGAIWGLIAGVPVAFLADRGLRRMR